MCLELSPWGPMGFPMKEAQEPCPTVGFYVPTGEASYYVLFDLDQGLSWGH